MSISLRAALLAAALALQAASAHAAPLTIAQAIERAIAAAPLLRANEAAIVGAQAGRVQAGIRPNPSVTLEAENFTGTGNYSVLDQSEITASYNQTIERGGKRAARLALADSDIAVAQAAVAVTRLDLAAQVQRAFLDVLLADEGARVADDMLVIARGLQSEAQRRVRSAKDPLFVGTAADARVANARIDLDQAKRRQATAREQLASFWGESGETLVVSGEVLSIAGDIAARPLAEADVILADAEVDRAKRQIALERTRAVQDYTLSGGARFLRNTNDVAVVGTVTIPLGRFDRNQGNIARTQAEQRRLELTAEASRLDRLRTLAGSRRDAEAAVARVQAIRTEVYPRVTRAMAQVQTGYARGGFSFRDMQDAADEIFSTQADYLEALAVLRAAQAQIDRLTGRFDTFNSAEISR